MGLRVGVARVDGQPPPPSTLDDLVGGAEEAGPDAPRYGVLVALYRQGDSASRS